MDDYQYCKKLIYDSASHRAHFRRNKLMNWRCSHTTTLSPCF